MGRSINGTAVVDRLLLGRTAAASAGLLGGTGTSSNKYNCGTSTGHIYNMYATSAATGGDITGRYDRLYGTAVNTGDFIAGRSYCTVSAATSGAYGRHDSLSFGSSAGSVTGQGSAGRFNLLIPNRALAANGTYSGLIGEVYCEGTSSDASAVTAISIMRLQVQGGDATSCNTIKNAISFEHGGTDGTGNMIYTHAHSAGNAAGSIRVLINGTAKYLKFWDAE